MTNMNNNISLYDDLCESIEERFGYVLNEEELNQLNEVLEELGTLKSGEDDWIYSMELVNTDAYNNVFKTIKEDDEYGECDLFTIFTDNTCTLVKWDGCPEED